MDEKNLRNRLEDMGYTEEQKGIIISDLSKLNSQLYPILESWCKDGQILDFEYCSEGLFHLMDKYQINYVSALLTMDWIMEEPLEARNILSKGIM